MRKVVFATLILVVLVSIYYVVVTIAAGSEYENSVSDSQKEQKIISLMIEGDPQK